MIRSIRALHPRLSILIGGQGLRQAGPALVKENTGVFYFSDLYSLDNFLLKGGFDDGMDTATRGRG